MTKNRFKKLLSSGISLVLLSSISSTLANSIDCSHINTSAETNICSSTEIIKLDKQLSEVYAKLYKTKSFNKTSLQNSQKQWLLTRDQCTDSNCLNNAYINRITEFKTELRSLHSYKPDKVDMLAIDQLKQAVEKLVHIDNESPLEMALQNFEIKNGTTSFFNTSDNNDPHSELHFPSKRPVGVSESEWRVLVKSNIEGGGENGTANYTLIDIDGDGKRDLIIDSYIGGTGLFNYISVIQQKGESFVGKYVSENNDDLYDNADEAGQLYSLNGRGSNQSATWVKLQGRVYAAYRNSYYGVDHVYLLRPLYINERTPILTVHYAYTLSIPKKQTLNEESTGKSSEYHLDPKTYAALNEAIKHVDPASSHDLGAQKSPICPPPENISEDDRYGYFSFGPGHYSYEIVADMPISIDKTCYIGRFVDWFGSYNKKTGLLAQLWMKLPNSDKETSFELVARRKAVKIKSGIETFGLDS